MAESHRESFSAKVIRSLPFWMGSAFVISLGGLLVDGWLNDRLQLTRILGSAVALALVWSSAAAPVTAYFVRKAERIPLRSSRTMSMVLFSLLSSVVLGALGFFLLGCAGFAGSCMSISNLEISVITSLAIGGFLSLMALSS
jgi:hypothetical protein